MAIGETAKLLASLELQDKFTPAIKNANRALGRFDSKLADTGSRGYKAGQQIGTGLKNVGKLAVAGFGILAANVALGVDSLIKVENAQAQTNAVIKSTGGVAGVSAEQVRKLAEQYEALNATMGDEVIQSGENLLLTFTNIHDKAFEPALQAALDMNQRLGKGPEGLTTTIKTLGKALNDPTKGLGALGKAGVTFDKTQTKRIKQLQKEGKLYEAQQIILAELEKRFGGAFAAAGGTTEGKVAKFTDSIEDLQRALATALLPTIGNVADALTEFLSDPQTVKDFENLGRDIAKLFSPDNIRAGIGALKDGFTFVRGIAGPIADVIGTAVKAFTSLPPEVQKLLVGGFAVNKLTGGLVTNIAGGIFGALKAMTVQAGIVNVTGKTVAAGGAAGAAGAVAGGGSKVGKVIGGAAAAVTIVGSALAVLETQSQVSQQNTQLSQGIKGTLDQMLTKSPSREDLTRSLGAVETGIHNLEANPLNAIVQGEALDNLRAMKASLEAALKAPTGDNGLKGKQADDKSWADIAANTKDTAAQIIASRERVLVATDGTTSAVKDTKAAVGTAKTAIDGAKRATEIGSSNVQSTVRSGTGSIVAAVNAIPAPIVNLYVSAGSVTKNVQRRRRHGHSSGSSGGGTGQWPGGGEKV